jgi:tRNA(fMet)-specific endonuclease VapC
VICIDTNVAIAALNGRPVQVIDRLAEALSRGLVALPAPSLHELWYGAAKSARISENIERIERFLSGEIVVLPFDAEDAREAGFIRAHLKPLGIPIGNYDVLIAAQALRRGMTLVSANVGEFERVPGLIVVNWMAM